MSFSTGRLSVEAPQSAVDPAGAASGDLIHAQGKSLPHVCFVSLNLYPILAAARDVEMAGGAEVQQAILSRSLKELGYRVSVLTGSHGQPAFVMVDGIEIHALPSPQGRGVKGLRFIFPSMTDIVAGLTRIDPDIVYFRVAGFRAAAVCWYARRRKRRFLYACASDREFMTSKASQLSRRDSILFHYALRRADCVLTQNKQQQDLFKANFGRDSIVIPNTYNERSVGHAEHSGPVVWVGTFKPIKQPELFIELARNFPARRFVMVGGADHANDPGQEFHRRMRSLAGDVRNLDFVGYIPFADVGRYFDGASVFVNTSHTEGFPNTFLQAWIRSIPTLSFVGPEVIPGEVGTIVCGDMHEMTDRLGTLIANRAAWDASSQACKAHFQKNHSTHAVLHRYRELFSRWSSPSVGP